MFAGKSGGTMKPSASTATSFILFPKYKRLRYDLVSILGIGNKYLQNIGFRERGTAEFDEKFRIARKSSSRTGQPFNLRSIIQGYDNKRLRI